jgi:predicted nucleotidyltransferase
MLSIPPIGSELLGDELARALPEVVFALQFGSSLDTSVSLRSDLDLALFLEEGADPWSVVQRAQAVVERMEPRRRPDVGLLNRADPVFRFEAAKGRLLFCRDQERYLEFVCAACRAFELQMVSYARQRQYRLEVSHGDQRGDPAQAGPAR